LKPTIAFFTKIYLPAAETFMVDRLDYLIDHPELWEKLGSQGREIVEQKSNLSKQVTKA
jgi:hypothetical protein